MMNDKDNFLNTTEDIPESAKSFQNYPLSGTQIYLYSALLLTIYTTIIKLVEIIQDTYGFGSFFGVSGRAVLSLWPFYLFIIFIAIGIFFIEKHQTDAVEKYVQIINHWISRLGYINVVIFLLLIGLFCLKFFIDLDLWIFDDKMMPLVFFHLGMLGAIHIKGIKKTSLLPSLVISFSIYALVLFIVYWIPSIHTYPLTMGWSEGSRYYYASLFFSERLYGFQVPLPSMHPTRYLMQSVPFLIPNSSIWVHRLWQVFLWIVLPLTCGLALVRRIQPKYSWLGLGIVSWFTVFIFQGPVYYHLLVVILIVLLGFNHHDLRLSLLFVVLASLWAGISRVNWFPVAGMLAATLYILEIPQGKKTFWQYWWWPVMTVFIGLIVAFGAQAIYVVISGRAPEDFTSSFNSPLLLYRLFPNTAFGPGILLMLVIASLFSIIIILKYLVPNLRVWRPLRLLGLLSILIALMVSGIIVSLKIGGGNNLHNLDAFLVFLAVITIYVMFSRFMPEDQERFKKLKPRMLWILLGALVLMNFMLENMRPYPSLDNNRAWQDISEVQEIIEKMVPEGGEVLFIHNRHLLTFNMIKGVKLVPEYEKVFLMEMAMSENQSYLEAFKNDINNHRFDLIVTEPLFLGIKESSEHFAEENNAWVIHVSNPIDQSYQTIFDTWESAMSVMIPKAGD